MEDFYFTFGQGHFSLEGVKMCNRWVRVTAPDEMEARRYFSEHFATPVMGSPTKWAFSYKEKDFKRSFFPDGEYEHLAVSTPLNKFILGYPVGKDVAQEYLVVYANKEIADSEAEEWLEISAASLDDAKAQFEVKFAEWQKSNS